MVEKVTEKHGQQQVTREEQRRGTDDAEERQSNKRCRRKMSSQLKPRFPELAFISECYHALFLINSPQCGGAAEEEWTLSCRLGNAD